MPRKETWLPVVGFEGRYEVSSIGRVRSLFTDTDAANGIMRLQTTERGYLRVRLSGDNGRRPWRRVHRMVCEAFNGPPPSDDYTVDHRDFKKRNNSRYNVRWMARTANWERWYERERQNDDSSPAPF